MLTRSLLPLAFAVLVSACGSSEPDNSDPPVSTKTDAGNTPTLSAAFKNNCVPCHGANGQGIGTAPKIPGALSVTAFIAAVRSGNPNGMQPFKASQISDDDLKSDYAILKTK